MGLSTIGGINHLSDPEKREIYTRVIPPELLDRFQLNPFLVDNEGNDLFLMTCPPGSSSVEVALRHVHDFPDPVLYGHMTDTINGQFHILLYILNDPFSPRFDIDRLPDGEPTQFGIQHRNIGAEIAAMEAGLAPGQIRQGLGLLTEAIVAFERFIGSLSHDIYFVEPLHYHNAILFEQQGFNYQIGRRRMNRIQLGFSSGGNLLPLLDGSTPFRQTQAADSIRLRSWAIHDGVLGSPLTNITMYKNIGEHAGVSTAPGLPW